MITYYNFCILLSKVVEQLKTSHVFFHSFTNIFHTVNVLQWIGVIVYGALLGLMLMENTPGHGETVTATVEQVLSSNVKSRAGAQFF